MFSPVRFHHGLTNSILTLSRCYCNRNIVNSKIKSILISTKLGHCCPMHLRTMWHSRAAANGRKCIRLEHTPSVLAIFRAKNPHRGLGAPPLSKRQIASRQAIPAQNGMFVDHPLRRAEEIGRTSTDPQPWIMGMALPWFWGGGRQATTIDNKARKRHVTQLLYQFPRMILLCATRNASSLQYLRYDKCNSLILSHNYLQIIVHYIERRLQRQPTFAPRTYCSGNCHLIRSTTIGLFVFKRRRAQYQFCGGGESIHGVAKLGRKSLAETWLCNR